MKNFCGVLVCALLGILGLSGCAGTGSGRQLMSLTITPQSATAQNGQAQFVATGHFNTAPTTVTPMVVAWHQSAPAFDPPGQVITFTTTQQPFAAQCLQGGPQANHNCCLRACRRERPGRYLSPASGLRGFGHQSQHNSGIRLRGSHGTVDLSVIAVSGTALKVVAPLDGDTTFRAVPCIALEP